MAGSVDLDEGEVPGGLDLAVLLTVSLEGRQLGALEVLVAGPVQLVGPSLVTEPVADEVGITGIDEDRDLLEQARNEQVEGLHPVALEKEVTVDVEVAAVVAVDSLDAEGFHDVLLVEVLVDVSETRVAE